MTKKVAFNELSDIRCVDCIVNYLKGIWWPETQRQSVVMCVIS